MKEQEPEKSVSVCCCPRCWPKHIPLVAEEGATAALCENCGEISFAEILGAKTMPETRKERSEMRTLCISKAAGDEVKNLQIMLFAAVPAESMTLEQCGKFYQGEGALLADALRKTLPGGTLDQLLMKLLESRASLLKVPMFEDK